MSMKYIFIYIYVGFHFLDAYHNIWILDINAAYEWMFYPKSGFTFFNDYRCREPHFIVQL